MPHDVRVRATARGYPLRFLRFPAANIIITAQPPSALAQGHRPIWLRAYQLIDTPIRGPGVGHAHATRTRYVPGAGPQARAVSAWLWPAGPAPRYAPSRLRVLVAFFEVLWQRPWQRDTERIENTGQDATCPG